MNKIFKNLFKAVLLATLVVAATSCTDQKKMAEAVKTTLTAASAMNATVDARVHDTQVAMQVSVPPMEIVISPTPTPAVDIAATVEALNITETAIAAPEPEAETPIELSDSDSVTISSPANDSTVSQYTNVSGFVKKTALEGKFLNLIVTTRTREYWVQMGSTIQENGNWTSLVILGTDSLGMGEKFTICAVIANQQSPEGRIYSYPDGPKACIDVTREK